MYFLRDGTKVRVMAGKQRERWIVEEVFARHSYTQYGLDIGRNDTVVDIGAHIWIFTIYAAKKAVNGIVLAYEPIPENFKRLKINVTLNDLRNVLPFNMGVASKEGKRIFYRNL